MQNSLFTPFFTKLEVSTSTNLGMSPPALRKEIEKTYKKMSDALGLRKMLGENGTKVIPGYALWLMTQITPVEHKGGMLTRRTGIIRTSVAPRIPDADENVNVLGTNPEVHELVLHQEEQDRRRKTPSASYIIMLCVSIAIAMYLIVESYHRGLKIAMELNQSVVENTENNEYFNMLTEILNDQEYADNGNDGGYMFSVWNSLAKGVGLSRMPNSADTYVVTQRLLEELSRDAAGGLNKALIQCGHVIIPQRYEYADGVQGLLQFNSASAIAHATNLAAGTGPLQCALQITGAKSSAKITNFITTAMIESTALISKISIIKNLLSIAFALLTFAVPSVCLVIKHGLSEDSALLALRESEAAKHANAVIDDDEEPTNYKRIGAGFRKSKKNKRKSKQMKRNVKQTKRRR